MVQSQSPESTIADLLTENGHIVRAAARGDPAARLMVLYSRLLADAYQQQPVKVVRVIELGDIIHAMRKGLSDAPMHLCCLDVPCDSHVEVT